MAALACALASGLATAQPASNTRRVLVEHDRIDVVWSSKSLPGSVIVAYGTATSTDRSKLKSRLGHYCSGSAKAICGKLGIRSMKPASESQLSAAIHLYD